MVFGQLPACPFQGSKKSSFGISSLTWSTVASIAVTFRELSSKITTRDNVSQMNTWSTIHLNWEDMTDHLSYTHNLWMNNCDDQSCVNISYLITLSTIQIYISYMHLLQCFRELLLLTLIVWKSKTKFFKQITFSSV